MRAGFSVVICDGQEIGRAGLRAILERQPDFDVVGEAASTPQAVSVAEDLRPDVVVVDSGLPEVGGIEAARRLAGPDVRRPLPVAMLVADADADRGIAALQAGARGLFLKGRPTEELLYGLRAIAAGEGMIAPPIVRGILDRFAAALHCLAPLKSAIVSRLTARELDVLQCLAQGLSIAEIAAALFLSESTVKSHTYSLLHKLGARDRVHAVALAYQHGLVRSGWQAGAGALPR